jgi:hypothetical protein
MQGGKICFWVSSLPQLTSSSFIVSREDKKKDILLFNRLHCILFFFNVVCGCLSGEWWLAIEVAGIQWLALLWMDLCIHPQATTLFGSFDLFHLCQLLPYWGTAQPVVAGFSLPSRQLCWVVCRRQLAQVRLCYPRSLQP